MTERVSLSRRELLQVAGAATAALGLPRLGLGAQAPAPPLSTQTMMGVPFEARDIVRVGLVGCGRRGLSHLGDLVGIEKLEIKAVCDVVPEQVAKAQALIEKAGQRRPEGYAKGDHHFEELVRRDDLDLVYIATPWIWHAPMSLAAMNAGKHVGLEVPAVRTVEECWKLVETSERTRRHCVMLENCCYGWNEMLVLNMVRAGMFGELLHGECAYDHDLRAIVFENASEGLWRRAEHIGRNGNLYPTHGLGPVAQYMGIHEVARGRAHGLPEAAGAGGRPEMAREVRLRRREHEPHQDHPRTHDHAPTLRGQPPGLRPHQPDRGDQGDLPRLPGAALPRRPAGRREVDGPQGPEGALRASALEAAQEGRPQERPRRHGLRDELASRRVPAEGPRARHERVRRRGLERPRPSQRGVGGERQRARGVPGLHAGRLEGGAQGLMRIKDQLAFAFATL